MKTVDRVTLGALAVGIWTLVLLYVFDAKIAAAISSYEIYDLEDTVRNIVGNCSIYVHTVSGQVYVYDVTGGEGYGRITSGQGYGSISC